MVNETCNLWTFDETTEIVQRCGAGPIALKVSMTGETCPDVFELSNGDFAIIGTDVTNIFNKRLPDDAKCADYESIVAIPARTMHSAVHDIYIRSRYFVDEQNASANDS